MRYHLGGFKPEVTWKSHRPCPAIRPAVRLGAKIKKNLKNADRYSKRSPHVSLRALKLAQNAPRGEPIEKMKSQT
jgi:hypothetical protein